MSTIRELLQCRRSSAYCQQKKASTKRGHLISQVKNTSVKWSIKPRIVRTKTISKALRNKTVDWIMKNSNMSQSPISHDTLLIADADTKVKCRVPTLLLECSMRQLHNDIINPPDDGGLVSASAISKVSRDIGDSRTFELYIIQINFFLSQCLADFFGSNNAWFDRPFY